MTFRTASLSILLVSLVAPALRAAPAPGEEPAKSIDELKQDNQRRIEAGYAGLPVLTTRPVTDVVAFNYDHGRLLVHTNLENTENPARVDFKGMPGSAVIRIFSPPNAKSSPPKYFNLDYYDFSRPDLIDMHIQVLAGPATEQVVQDFEYPDRTESISMQQSLGPPGAESVWLRVQVVPEVGGLDKAMSIAMTAPSFEDLRREHAREVDRYVRPIFHDLQQEAEVFRPDPKVAWQVLGSEWKPDPQLLAKVDEILKRLRAAKFQDREEATVELQQIGEPAAQVLTRMKRDGWSEEQRTRVDAFLGAYHPVKTDEAVRLGTDVDFLLDCLYSDDATVRQLASAQLARVTGKRISLDPRLDEADRAAAVANLRSKLAPPPTTEPSAPSPGAAHNGAMP